MSKEKTIAVLTELVRFLESQAELFYSTGEPGCAEECYSELLKAQDELEELQKGF